MLIEKILPPSVEDKEEREDTPVGSVWMSRWSPDQGEAHSDKSDQE